MVKVFGTKFKKALRSLGEFLYDVISIFDPKNIAEADRLWYEMNNPFRLRDYEILISKDPDVYSILESLRKKAGISDIVLRRGISLERIIRRLIPPTPKEKVEYVKALREAASGELDPSKYRKDQVGPNVTLKFVKYESRKLEHGPYRDK